MNLTLNKAILASAAVMATLVMAALIFAAASPTSAQSGGDGGGHRYKRFAHSSKWVIRLRDRLNAAIMRWLFRSRLTSNRDGGAGRVGGRPPQWRRISTTLRDDSSRRAISKLRGTRIGTSPRVLNARNGRYFKVGKS